MVGAHVAAPVRWPRELPEPGTCTAPFQQPHPSPLLPALESPPAMKFRPPQQSAASSPPATRRTIPDLRRASFPRGPHPCTKTRRNKAPAQPSPRTGRSAGEFATHESRFVLSPCPARSVPASFSHARSVFSESPNWAGHFRKAALPMMICAAPKPTSCSAARTVRIPPPTRTFIPNSRFARTQSSPTSRRLCPLPIAASKINHVQPLVMPESLQQSENVGHRKLYGGAHEPVAPPALPADQCTESARQPHLNATPSQKFLQRPDRLHLVVENRSRQRRIRRAPSEYSPENAPAPSPRRKQSPARKQPC